MPLPIRTAVVASAGTEMLHRIALLLAKSGIMLEGAAQNGIEAIQSLERVRPDLLIVDEQLPSISGTTLAKRTAHTFCLPVRPRIILLHYPEFVLPKQAENELSGIYLLEKPLSFESFSLAIDRLSQSQPFFTDQETARAEKLLDELGFNHQTGRELIKNAALIAAQNEYLRTNIGSKLIPLAAEMCAVSPDRAERAMRYAVAQAWRSDKFENQCRIFSDAVDARRGQPTLSEMISRLADILRLEG